MSRRRAGAETATVKRTMRSAWVITQEGTRDPTEVLAILSSRRTGRHVKERLEWLYMLLHGHPQEHFAAARYNNPQPFCEARYGQTNTGVPLSDTLYCGHNPFLIACLATNVRLVEREGEASVLEWTNPRIIRCDPVDRIKILEILPGVACSAPVHQPLRVTALEDDL